MRPKREEVACHSVDRKVESNAACGGPSLRISQEATAPCELGPSSARRRDRSEDCSASLVARKDGSHPMHRVTEESWLTDSADRSIARRAPSCCAWP